MYHATVIRLQCQQSTSLKRATLTEEEVTLHAARCIYWSKYGWYTLVCLHWFWNCAIWPRQNYYPSCFLSSVYIWSCCFPPTWEQNSTSGTGVTYWKYRRETNLSLDPIMLESIIQWQHLYHVSCKCIVLIFVLYVGVVSHSQSWQIQNNKKK